MKQINHWKKQENYNKRKDAEDRLVFWTLVLGGLLVICVI